MTIEIVRTVADLRHRLCRWRAKDCSIGLVPTMGSLHGGHLSLVNLSLEKTARTVVSLFINPGQFGAGEDFDAYPRDEKKDSDLLGTAGAHLLFAPKAKEMFAKDSSTKITVAGLGDMLEGEFRPGFFTGVATIVAKLLLQTAPDMAFFGEKDYQQLLVIRRMVNDMAIAVTIVSGTTLREADGLAMSSRNTYLTAKERAIAPGLYQVLKDVAANVASNNADIAEQTAHGMEALINAGFSAIDYLEVRDAETLAKWPGKHRPRRVLGAVHLAKTRLIDNIAI